MATTKECLLYRIFKFPKRDRVIAEGIKVNLKESDDTFIHIKFLQKAQIDSKGLQQSQCNSTL